MWTRKTIALVLTFMLVACGRSDNSLSPVATGTAKTHHGPGGGGILHIARLESFDGWKLDSAASYASYQTDAAVMEPLLRFAADGVHVLPGLAEKWDYDVDLHTWTFTLRDNAKFSNGQPVTAADVVFSFGVWLKGVNFGPSFAHMKKAVALDPRRVQFVLDAPDDTTPSRLSGSIAGVMPRDFAGLTETEFYKKPIGAGPFTVEKWSSGGRIELARNKYYYATDRPYFDQIVVDVVPDSNELTILFQGGQADIVEYVSTSSAAQYAPGSLIVTPKGQIYHLSLNAKKAPYSDPAVRRSIAAAIDYNAIAKGVLQGYGTAPTGILPPNLANWAPPSSPYYTTDVGEAKRLLATSRGARGFPAELIYDSGNSTDGLIAQVIQSNLAKIGIAVKLTGLEELAFLDRAYSLNADMIVWNYGPISPDISDPLDWIAGTHYLFTGADDTLFLKHLASYASSRDSAVKHTAVVAIQDDARNQAAAIALAEFPTIHAVAPRLRGFDPAPWGLYYWDTIRRE